MTDGTDGGATVHQGIRAGVIMLFRFLRGACLVAGMSIALLLCLEAGVRIVARVKGTHARRVVGPDSYVHSDWYASFLKDYDAATPQRWLPWVYFGRLPSYHSATVNVDSLGRRVTPQPAVPATPAVTVYFMGGSTMWGTGQRDDHTIAAEASRRLQPLVGPDARIEVVNLGESGYVTTQEVIKLMLALRGGARPDVVVFFDGINDVYATVQAGTAGTSQNEFKRAAEFEMGRAIDRNTVAYGLGKDLHAWRLLGAAALRQSALVEWLQSVVSPPPQPPRISADSAARATAGVYAGNLRLVETLSAAYGFIPLYVWQPTLHGTDKVPTAFEQRLLRSIEADSFQHRLQATYRGVVPLVDSAVVPMVHERFINATRVFTGDSGDVFVDRIGHNTEASVPKIVDAFWPALRDAVLRVRAMRSR